jgi:hypothetical protein
MQEKKDIGGAIIGALMLDLVALAIFTIGCCGESHWRMVAVLWVVVAIEIKAGRAFPMKDQPGLFRMLNRRELPTEFNVSIIMQITGTTILTLLVIAEFLRS